MYRIRKLPGREEYCIYGKNGRLKYKTTRRDLARRKLKSLLKQFWVNNTGNMENPSQISFGEGTMRTLKCNEGNYQCGGRCQRNSKGCPSAKKAESSATATKLQNAINAAKGKETTEDDDIFADLLGEETEADKLTGEAEDARIGQDLEDAFGGEERESNRLQRAADEAREAEDLEDAFGDRPRTEVEELEERLAAAMEAEELGGLFETTEADNLETQAREARESEDLATAFDDDDDDIFADLLADPTEADNLEDAARAARESQDLDDFANSINNPTEADNIRDELEKAQEREFFDDFARMINGDLTESEQLQEQADKAREREDMDDFANSITNPSEADLAEERALDARERQELEDIAEALGFSEPTTFKARVAAFNERRRLQLIKGDD